jgi:hypothetical protein
MASAVYSQSIVDCGRRPQAVRAPEYTKAFAHLQPLPIEQRRRQDVEFVAAPRQAARCAVRCANQQRQAVGEAVRGLSLGLKQSRRKRAQSFVRSANVSHFAVAAHATNRWPT